MSGYPSSCWPTEHQPTRHRFEACQYGVWAGASPALWSDVRGSPDKEESTTDYADDVDWLHNIHHFAHQHLELASDRIKAGYDQLSNSAGFQEGNRVWLYSPAQKTEKSHKRQKCWEDPYINFTRIKDVIYRIKRHSTAKMNSRLPGQTITIPGVYSGQVALRREQYNRGQQRLVVWRRAKTLTSRLLVCQ